MCYDIFINEMEVILMSSKGFGYCGLACDYCQDNPNCVGAKREAVLKRKLVKTINAVYLKIISIVLNVQIFRVKIVFYIN